jgi:hypothetical protein
MKRLLVIILLGSLCCCDDDDEPTDLYLNIAGKITGLDFRNGRSFPFAKAEIDINLYVQEGPSLKLVKTEKLVTDVNGHFEYQEELNGSSYSGFTLDVIDKYYKSCSGFLSPDDTILVDYQALSHGGQNVSIDLSLCSTSIVKIDPNKLDPLSDNMASLTKVLSTSSFAIVDAKPILLSDEEIVCYFFSQVTSVDFKVKVKNSSQTMDEYTTQVITVPGETKTLTIDY